MITMIWAQDSQKGIGIDNKLPWNIPDEMKHFKTTTIDKIVVMGANTYRSIGHILPNRTNVILTTDKTFKVEGAIVCHNVDEVLEMFQLKDIYIIGGKRVYESFLPYAHRLIISQINKDYHCNVFMDKVNLEHFTLKKTDDHYTDFKVEYYERKLTSHNKNILNIKIENFDGPLDVLSTLIQEKKIDIMQVNLIEIIDQYLSYIDENIDDIEINNAIAYVQMATYLINLKSKKMLETNIDVVDENSFEYERDKLLKRIIEYNKYKRITQYLNERMAHREKMFSKFDDNSESEITETTIYEDKIPEKINVEDITKIIVNLVEKYRFDLLKKKGMAMKEVKVSDVYAKLLNFLKKHSKTTLCEYITKHVEANEANLSYFVILFYTFLELSKTLPNNIELNQIENDIGIAYN